MKNKYELNIMWKGHRAMLAVLEGRKHAMKTAQAYATKKKRDVEVYDIQKQKTIKIYTSKTQ